MCKIDKKSGIYVNEFLTMLLRLNADIILTSYKAA